MKIKCVLTDDEPIARKGLRSYIEKLDYLELAGECEDAIQLNTLLRTTPTDLIFLDIEMPFISGLDYLSSIRQPPKVIITSAYEQYALKGYELDVCDYLLKPIPFERFLKAAEKVRQILKKEKATEKDDNHIFVKCDKSIKRINLYDILFIESMENYVVIHSVHSKDITGMTLKHILESLPSHQFLQVHRSYIVNMRRIELIDGNLLTIGKHRIPVARNYREAVQHAVLRDRLI